MRNYVSYGSHDACLDGLHYIVSSLMNAKWKYES